MHLSTAIATFSCLIPAGFCKSLWQETTPQTPQPYALKKSSGIALVGSGTTSTYFPITGNSSDNAFTLMITTGSSTGGPNAFPHVHRQTYETFYASKGRLQMWGESNEGFLANTSVQTTRIMMPGDFSAIPNNTIHMFQFMEPETQLISVLAPGSFERYFFSSAIMNALNLTGPLNETELAPYDVYPQRNFTPQYDLVDNKAGPGNWHDGPNELPLDDKDPIWVAKDYGPKWLHSKDGVFQIVSPFVGSQQTNALFAHGSITMSHKPKGVVPSSMTSPHATAFMVEEGQLAVMVKGFRTAHLVNGDVFFVPPNTLFSYYAEAYFTKFLYVSGGGDGIDAMLIADSVEWSSPFYPREAPHDSRRGFMM
ncbi:RmlC-like cupin domain-containing protein [Dactylonectria estremocensis]|uniref:RmlC-like cupin domain-containing protein n=1 Tax=Dactylonectria estremocensis TaxID=1079267 RepID=A0A9P9EFY0_9HYPO|nr:RmlC-like cupin domain-containing protein [Dactylonectria estremocensis]